MLVALGAAGLSLGFTVSVVQERNRARLAEARAVEEAATTRQVSEFLTSLFTGADPNLSGHPSLSAAELVDKGRERIAADLRGQPAEQANLLAVLAKIGRAHV